jgi:hypothetical protein
VPAVQPPGPDGRAGLWAWVAEPAGGGTWEWYAAPGDGPTGPKPPRGSWQLLAGGGVVVGLALLAVGLAGPDDSPAAPVSAGGGAGVSDDERTERLIATANSFVRALLGGDAEGVATLLDPVLCSESERSAAVRRAENLAAAAAGAAVKVRSVVVDGDRGLGLDWEFPSDAPAAVQALAPGTSVPKAQWPWRWRDGQWRYAGDCMDDSTEPTG